MAALAAADTRKPCLLGRPAPLASTRLPDQAAIVAASAVAVAAAAALAAGAASETALAAATAKEEVGVITEAVAVGTAAVLTASVAAKLRLMPLPAPAVAEAAEVVAMVVAMVAERRTATERRATALPTDPERTVAVVVVGMATREAGVHMTIADPLTAATGRCLTAIAAWVAAAVVIVSR